MRLRVATCQFPTSARIDENLRHVLRQMRQARERGARIAHFPEGCLSGYVPQDVPTFAGLDWERLLDATREVLACAEELGIWAVVGSAHRLSGPRKPHNCLYVVGDRGRLEDRYDKRICAGAECDPEGETIHYSAGDHESVFTVDGIRCGALICHEYRYPELYRDYKRRGVQLVFHSYHAASYSPRLYRAMQEQVGAENHSLNRGTTLPEITMPATMQGAAAANHLWISCANSSARESCWASFVVRPDGVIVGRLRRNAPGVLVTEIDSEAPLYDGSGPWRARVMRGTLRSGRKVKDLRSERRREL